MLNPDHRRRRLVLGAAGLAAVLGVGAVVITDRLTDDAVTRDVAAISVPEPVVSTEPPSTTEPTSYPTTAAPVTASPTVTTVKPKPDPEVSKKIVIARSKAAADGVPLQRALTGRALNVPSDVQTTTTGSPQAPGGSLKVVTARGDLTGYEELSWVGDDGEPVGTARCTQQFRLSNDAKPTKRPTLLVCWRTSASRSVYTVAVNLKASPSAQASVAAIDKAWAKLG